MAPQTSYSNVSHGISQVPLSTSLLFRNRWFVLWRYQSHSIDGLTLPTLNSRRLSLFATIALWKHAFRLDSRMISLITNLMVVFFVPLRCLQFLTLLADLQYYLWTSIIANTSVDVMIHFCVVTCLLPWTLIPSNAYMCESEPCKCIPCLAVPVSNASHDPSLRYRVPLCKPFPLRLHELRPLFIRQFR